MSVRCAKTDLPGVMILQPDIFPDSRGFFLETWQKKQYFEFGIHQEFVQDNHSRSRKGVIRGLHYQLKNPQAKLVYAVRGAIFDVAVDIRRGSPTFGRWTGCLLSEDNRRQLFIPQGFAHGFSVLSDVADVIYKCSDYYTPGDEYGVIFKDPDIGIDWRIKSPIVSEKDGKYSCLKDISSLHLFNISS